MSPIDEAQSLQTYVSRAVHAAWEDHNSLGDEGKQLVGMPDAFGRRNTRLGAQITKRMRAAVAEWCTLPHLGVRVHTPRGSEDFGNSTITHTLWFSGLWGAHVYRAFHVDDIAAGKTPGYGVAFAVAEANPTFHQIRGAAMVRFDTGATLSRGNCGETWLSNKRTDGSGISGMTPVPYGLSYWDRLHHVVLSDAQSQEMLPFGTHDTYSTFGNTFTALTGRRVKTDQGATVPAVAVVASFGQALPAVYHLARGSDGDMFLPGYRHLGPQRIGELTDATMNGPAILGSRKGVALTIVGEMAKMAAETV